MNRILTLVFLMIGGLLQGQDYTLYHVGSQSDTSVTNAQGICLMGGAAENDSASHWFLQQASGGDVVVLRTSGGDAYNSYFYQGFPTRPNSVSTLVLHNASAPYDSSLLSLVKKADLIWLAGGDQWFYLSEWGETPLDSLIRDKWSKGSISIGGTSAGMAVLGAIRFDAKNGTISSDTALSRPFHPALSLDSSRFFGIQSLDRVITDTHYDNPDRRGRHLSFIARALRQNGAPIYGIACDEYTAVCIDSSGMARVFGSYPSFDDYAYFIQTNCEKKHPLPELMTSNQSLTWLADSAALTVYKAPGDSLGSAWFNIKDWQSAQGGQWQHWWAEQASLKVRTAHQPNCKNALRLTSYPSKRILRSNLHPAGQKVDLKLSISAPIQWHLINASGQLVARGQSQGRLTLLAPEAGFYHLVWSERKASQQYSEKMLFYYARTIFLELGGRYWRAPLLYQLDVGYNLPPCLPPPEFGCGGKGPIQSDHVLCSPE
jgi:cyanophycinase-like exopeptidase